MKKSRKVIPLFPDKVNEETASVEREEMIISDVKIEELERTVTDVLKESGESYEEEALPREATIGDWIVENCNELPIHEEADGRLVVAVPILIFDELVSLTVDSVNHYEVMKSALERIAKRENELEAKIARDALKNIEE